MIRRIVPSSLLGQVMSVLALGLLVAQIFSAVLLYQASEKRREAAAVSTVAFRVIAEQNRAERGAGNDVERNGRRLRENGERRRPPPRLGRPRPPGGSTPLARRLRFGVQISDSTPIRASETRLASYETALRDILKLDDMVAGEIAVVRRKASEDPFVVALAQRFPIAPPADWRERSLLVASVERPDGSGWMTVRQPEPAPPSGRLWTIILQTLVIFAVLVALLYLVLRRIIQPLAQLTDRVGDFSRNPDQAIQLEERGPSDTRRLIAAHNAMEARIAALLDEKDVMLGAIGHDLKTPLAALRVRIESVPDAIQREKMADSIEDITATLDDILTLSRVGRDRSGMEAVDLGALAIGVAEEFEDLGDPVSIANPPRLVATVQVTWVKRALRNLVSNAVRYGGSADISLLATDTAAILRVEDSGPGIASDMIAQMLEPFTRGETSRNRSTGGAGLGLTLARAVAEQHGGELVITNRETGGLRAEIRLPLGASE